MHDPNTNEAFVLPGQHPLRPGNINLFRRPIVHNPDGSYSTVDSTSFNIDGHEVLIPTVVGNKRVEPRAALASFLQTGLNLGTFPNAAAADRYANLLHQQQAGEYSLASLMGAPKSPLVHASQRRRQA